MEIENGLGAEFFTPKEIATLLHRKRTTIWAWIRAGRIGYCRVGGRSIVIPASELKRFLDGVFVQARD